MALQANEQIIINISPAGHTVIEAQGFSGCGCADATKDIELVLGGPATKRKEKPEFYAPGQTSGVDAKLTF